ncbi:MAG: sugar phosphate nucleotidyltransferase, partial [Oscillospiraceae bacterium]|nr:sugar phosphate nucleotidyltransferase [Oscillospiraceae bacterium]
DTLYKSNTSKTCSQQLIELFETVKTPLVSIHPVNLDDVEKYGILYGVWEDPSETFMKVKAFCEKPSREYAQDYLSMKGLGEKNSYYSVFGQYVLTDEVFAQLEKDIAERDETGSKEEIQLTSALDKVRAQIGLTGIVLNGKMFDIGNLDSYRRAVWEL